MPLKNVLRVLIAVQLGLFILLVHFLGATPASHVIAQGGTVTNVNIYPTPIWGGAYGDLRSNGSSTLPIIAGEVNYVAIFTNNETCKTRDLVAAHSARDVEQVQTVIPEVADTLLGIPPEHPHSISKLFTQQHTFNLAGRSVTLWSTTTQGDIADFRQGVGMAEGALVFVTTAQRLAESFNGLPANYQFMLPSGSWQITEDETDSCVQLNQTQEEPSELSSTLRNQIVVPQRICVGLEQPYYVVETLERNFCELEDIGTGCEPLLDLELETGQGSISSDETGKYTIQYTQEGTYTLQVAIGSNNIQRTVRAQQCSVGVGASPDSSIILEPPQLDLADIEFPQIELPFQQPQQTASILLSAIVSISLLIMLFVTTFAWKNRESNVFILKFRIWLLERK